MTLFACVMLVIGLTILTAGAECLVRGSARLAAAGGVSPLVIGLTVVAYGTSTPELAVSVKSAWAGQSDIALGNVVGSNIFNILLIVGACAVVYPLKVNVQLIRLDVPVMIGTSLLLLAMGYDGRVGRGDGAVLVTILIGYTVFVVRKSRTENKAALQAFDAEFAAPAKATARDITLNLFLVAAGLALLIYGARLFVNSAVDIAHAFGLSELLIGLTIVAIGTSLPEVATSLVATIRGERDIAIGNVVGSNISNIVAVLGVTSLVKPVHVPGQALAFDIPIVIAVSIACLPIFFTGMAISRWEGAVFLGYYVAYTAYLMMQTQASGIPDVFRVGMLYFVMPITAVTLSVLAAWEWRRLRMRAHRH